jgi:hypothetical protein
MSLIPRWNARFAKPLLNQTIALIQRDQQQVLDQIINPDRTQLGNPPLDPIMEFHKGPGRRTAFPWLVLGWDSNLFNEDSDHFRQSIARISLALDVGQYDQEIAQDNAADYARLLDIVITSADGPDWESSLPIQHETVPLGFTAPNSVGTVKRVFVENHFPGIVTIDQIQTPVLRIVLPVLFQLIEA